ncbi:hypothetical protein GGI42DRAFT_328303 [Trichoderma sp. SZMC 28013]
MHIKCISHMQLCLVIVLVGSFTCKSRQLHGCISILQKYCYRWNASNITGGSSQRVMDQWLDRHMTRINGLTVSATGRGFASRQLR